MAALPSIRTDIGVVVAAAGTGNRFGGDVPKQFRLLAGVAILEHTLSRLLAMQPACVVVALSGDSGLWSRIPSLARCDVVPGGASRSESVASGLRRLQQNHDVGWVMVHDGARPLITAADVARLIDGVGCDPSGGLLALPVVDTVKRERDGAVDETIPRERVWLAQTPQLFPVETLSLALTGAGVDTATDESSLVERLGFRPRLIAGRRENIKITHEADLALAQHFLAEEQSLSSKPDTAPGGLAGNETRARQ
jgi:2-C-methyl-D-erythritol 4-phosphate cytidylyltransferase